MATPTARPMPRPSAKDAPYFKGKQLESFLTDYEACCDEALYDDIKKCENLASILEKGWPSSATIQDPSRVQHLAKKGTIADRDQDDLFCKESLDDCRRWHIQTYERLKGLILQNHWNILLLTRHLPKSSSKLLAAHKKSKAKKSYYKHKSDSDSSSSSSSDSSDDESPAKEPESDSDSEVPVRATTSPKKEVVHHKAPVIPTIRNVADQVGELARSFDEMKIHLLGPCQMITLAPTVIRFTLKLLALRHILTTIPLNAQNQYMNKSAEGSGNNLVCWFCDKVGTHNVGMKNCPDAQAMIRQNLIKYSIEGQLVKMDGSRLPQGIPGQGGFKQAIIDEIKRFGSDIPNTSRSGSMQFGR
ncbi:hypothetical protein BS47DRAFT_1360503 [Hydnum rufescens UP504]|uniref:Uncharacterized protein n=1 Tax=Hydnum rufescens UP504 TaxID=1448309 RepID=A0A9P6B230_9AGAM|nr:hypothetical protein BS47DRAFT_1360503 [Hydnum rufescens UP504]